MSDLRAAQQALEALRHGVKRLNHRGGTVECLPLHEAITVLKAALAEPQEPCTYKCETWPECECAKPWQSTPAEPEFPIGKATTDVGVPVYVLKKAEPDLIRIQHNIMKTALEQIAGVRPIIDNLLSDKDIARITLERIKAQDEHSTGLRPTP